VTDTEFLAGYDGQSTAELLGFRGRYRTDSLVLALEEALGQKASRVGTALLTTEERIVLAVEGLEREVNNGGYEQFFLNESAEFAGEIATALETIGCPSYAATAQRALAALGISGQPSPAAIEAAMEAGGASLEERLRECDDAFFAVDGEDIAESLLEFVRTHAENITVP